MNLIKLKKYFVLLIIVSFYNSQINAQISGTVWKDLSRNGSTVNQYGIKEPNEMGVPGVTVTIFPGGSTTVTDVNGAYSFPAASGANRIEFSNWPNNLEESIDAGANNTSIQFITAPNLNVDFGLYSAKEYVNSDPFVASAILLTGGHNVAPNQTSASIATWHSSWGPTSASGTSLANNQVDDLGAPAPPTTVAQKQDVGAVYGMVFDKKRNKLYASTILKAHTDFGPAGGGAIYSIPVDPNTGVQTSAVSTLIDIPSADLLGAHVRTDIGTQTYDDTVIGLVGKSSFGDMDISEDYNFLYVMNLATRQVHEINLNTNVISRTFDVPLNDGMVGGNCPTTDDVRPFGLGIKNNELYIGLVCTNESQPFDNRYRSDGFTANYFSGHPRWQMRAYVYSQDLSIAAPLFSKVLDWDLDGRDHTAVPPNNDADDNFIAHSANKGGRGGWMPWESSWADIAQSIDAELVSFGQGPFTNVSNFNFGTPLLSDIVFFGEDMTVAFRDRTADQWGPGTFSDLQMPAAAKQVISKGDIYLVYKDAMGNYQFEDGINGGSRTSTVCTVNAGGFRNYCEGCAGSTPPDPMAAGNTKGGIEWYHSDGTSSCTTPPHQGGGHRENIFGGLSQISGGSLITTQMNPPIPVGQNITSTGGVVYIDQSNGNPQREYMLYHGSTPDGLSKANGIGDVEVLSFTPIELGNLIWSDANGNGVQDPDEPGISNVSIQLLDSANTVLSSAITDGNGNYIFSNNPDGTDTPSRKYNITALNNLTQLTIRIQDISGGSQQVALSGLTLTTNDIGQGTNSDLNDSDGTISAVTDAIISITNVEIENVGQNTHSYDFGFAPLASEDWGDAPDSGVGNGLGNYSTLASDNGPRHVIGAALFMGACVDDELDGQQSVNANGDDNGLQSTTTHGTCATANDDEDGLIPPILSDGQVAPTIDVTVVNTTMANSTVACWIDYNADGMFDNATERGSVMIAANGVAAVVMPDVPVTASTDTSGSTFMRCRIATSAADVANSTGSAATGEVEDYQITINPSLSLGDYVWYDNNQNGLQDASEPGVNGITVELFTNATCTGASSQTTITANGGLPAADGWYNFSPLASGDYCIQFSGLAAGWVITSQNQGGDDTLDSDADAVTGQIQNITLTADDPTNDMGIYAAIGNIPGQVYCDANLSLTYDAGEEQSGIAVTLLRDSDCDGTGDVTIATLDTDGTGSFDFTNLPVGLSPIPPNPAVCYVINYDLADADLTGCSQPFLPVTSVVELSTDTPSAPPSIFGNHAGVPLMIPVNKWWALLLLSVLILLYARRIRQN